MSTEEIIASDSSNFTPHPEGQFRAVCCDIVDLGMVETTFQGKTKQQHKIRVAFQTDEPMDDGRPFTISQRFTLSLNEKGRLRPFLEAWRGRAFSADEVKGFNVAKLLGANAMIQVTHAAVGDKTYANITSIMRPMKGMEPLTVTSDYVRVKDRPVEGKPASAPQPAARSVPAARATVPPRDEPPPPDEPGWNGDDADDLPW